MTLKEKGMSLQVLSGTPSVSVAIATYQGERYLRQQLQSIAGQKLLPMEVVITDDQSSDATAQIAEEFARSAPFPVRFYRNETRLRYAENFMRAASLCRGELLAFCDQDDIWLENKLSTCVPPFQDPDVQLICHSAQTVSGEGQLGYFFPHFKKTRKLPLGACDPLENRPGFAMIFRKDMLSVLSPEGRPERLIPHDHWVWFLASFTGKVVKMAEVVCHYRQHESNVFGASEVTVGRKLRVATETPRYLDVANAELECSRFLTQSLEQLAPEKRQAAKTSAEQLALRGKLHQLRFRMYGGQVGIVGRARTYMRILLIGGYFPDLSKTRLGPKAALKDLVMGVAGMRRVLGSPGI